MFFRNVYINMFSFLFMFYTEKQAEDFLEKQGVDIVNRVFVKSEEEVVKINRLLNFPWVMKVSGRKILHKKIVNGVIVNVKNLKDALRNFNVLNKIKNSEGVLVQEQIKGKEFLLGVKRTSEFGHVLVFGAGGSSVEEKKDISFRVCPVLNKDIEEMIEDVLISVDIKDRKLIIKNMIMLCEMVKKYPKISELDINPFISGKIVDAKIVFE